MRPENLFPLYLLFLSHIIADYVCQPKGFTRQKRKKTAYFFLHVGIVWAAGLLVLFPYWSGKTLLGVSILAISHLIIDWSKITLERKRGRKNTPFPIRGKGNPRLANAGTPLEEGNKGRGINSPKIVNVVDQGFHFLAVVLVWRVFLTGLPWPFSFLLSPVFLNSVAILVIILIMVRGGIGILSPEEEDQ